MAFEVFNFGKQLGIVRGVSTTSPETNTYMRQPPLLPEPTPTTFPFRPRGGNWEPLPFHDPGIEHPGGDAGVGSSSGSGGSSPGGGGGSRGRKETEEEKKRREAIEALKEKLNFWDCGPVAGDDPDNPAHLCCSEEERYKIATTLYYLLNNEKVKSTPGMADCLMNAAVSKIIRCSREESPNYNFHDPYYSENLSDYKSESRKGRWNIWEDKLGDRLLLMEGLMENCGIGETPQYTLSWTSDLWMIMGNPSKVDICNWLKSMGWNAKKIRQECQRRPVMLVGRYSAYNLCTGEVIRLSSFDKKEGPKGPVVEKWSSGKDCLSFGYQEKDKEIGLEFITNS